MGYDDVHGGKSDAELLDDQRKSLTASSKAEAPRITRCCINQILARKHARCLSAFTSLTSLRLALPPHQMFFGRTDDWFLFTIINSINSFPHLNTLLLEHQEGRKPVHDPVDSLVMQPLMLLPALTSLRINAALTLTADCLQLLCGLPHLVLLDVRECWWTYKPLANAEENVIVVLECSATLRTLLLPHNGWRNNEPLFGSLDIRGPQLDYLCVHMHCSTLPWPPVTIHFSAVTVLRLTDARHTVLSQLHNGMVRRLPNLRHIAFDQ